MNCESVKKLIDDYVFGLLSDEEAAGVREHLSLCASCEASVGESQRFRTSLSRWEAIEPRKGFAEKVAYSAWRESYLPFVRVCRAIAIAASLLAAVIIYFHFSATPAAMPPVVLGIAPHITTQTGVLQDVSEVEVEFPAGAEPESIYIFLRLFQQENEILSVKVEANGHSVGDFYRLPASGGQPQVPCAYLISRRSVLRAGKNSLIMRNMTDSPVRYELIGCCDVGVISPR